MIDLPCTVDELGPAKILYICLPDIDLRGILVVDNVAAGPSIGGLRMAPDVSLSECLRLARAMTLKNAVAGLPHGGGKSVLMGDPRLPREQKEQLIRAFACAVGDIEDYIFGPDMGTDEACMAWVKDEIGRSVGLPAEFGGIPLDQIGATGWGLSQAVAVALNYCDFDLPGARIAIQGFGAVGRHTARFLAAQGAQIVAVSDSRGTLHDPDGLDLAPLLELKAEGRSVCDAPRGKKLPLEAIVTIPCDIWIPAARPDVIHADNVRALDARLVVQGANIPLTREAEAVLHQRGILTVPDFVANAGGVICAAVEYQGLGESAAFQTIESKLRDNTDQVLSRARKRGIMPREAAEEIAVQRVRQAMALRRWSLF